MVRSKTTNTNRRLIDMANNNSGNNNPRYILIELDTFGGNDLRKLFQETMKFIQDKTGYIGNFVYVNGEEGEALFEKQWKAFQSALGKKIVKDNITLLVQKVRGYSTGFQGLDKAIDSVRDQGQARIQTEGLNKLFSNNGVADFHMSFNKGSNVYQLVSTIIAQNPYQDPDGNHMEVEMQGEKVLLYKYTFEFSPNQGSPSLDELHTFLNSDEDKVFNSIKAVYCHCAGWGAPAISLDHNDEIIWYSTKDVLMSLEGNCVHVLAPHPDNFGHTANAVAEIKKSMAGVEPEVAPTPTPKPIKAQDQSQLKFR